MSLYKMIFEDPKTKKYTALVGSIVIVVAMAGIFIHEAGAYKTINLEDINIKISGQNIIINWESVTVDVISETGNLNEGASAEHSWENENYILNDVVFELTWQDDVYLPTGDPNDEFRLSTSGPDVNPDERSSTNELISIPYDASVLNSQPEDFKTQVSSGASDEEINEQLELQYNAWLEVKLEEGAIIGIGTWNSEVTAVNCEGYAGRIINFLDNGNSYNIKITVIYWKYSWTTEESE